MGGWLDTLRRVAPVRFVIMAVVMLAALVGVQLMHFAVFKHLPPFADDVLTLGLCGVAAGIYVLMVRLFERRAADELSLRPGLRWAPLGRAIGCGLFCIVYAVLLLLGVASWGGFRGFAGVPTMLLLAVIAGVGEELVFRGVLFRVLEDSLGTAIALIISAAIFGLLHGLNPGATLVSTLAIALEAGAMLAAAYAWSRNLWLPIALHAAWNFTEGGVFGAAVSGGTSKGIFAVTLSPAASPLLTGGAFGPEASVVAIAAGVILAAIFIAAARRAGHWRAPSFRMMLA